MVFGLWKLDGPQRQRRLDRRYDPWVHLLLAPGSRPSVLYDLGNAAFDAYKADTLRRLEEEQQQFEAFMDRLRAAKDQSEFDEFMKDRSRKTEDKSAQAEA